MTLVAGVDSSTQSCKVVVCEADTGTVVRHGSAPHPPGTEVDPRAWEEALHAALAAAGGLGDVAGLSIAAQQHGLVCLDAGGDVVRPALLWNDTRSAGAASDLVDELGGPQAWAQAVGSVPVASFTVAKLRWLSDHEPEAAARVAAVCLPHDWLTWRLLGAASLDGLVTDRGDASGTGYWSPVTGQWRPDLVKQSLGRDVLLPRILGPHEPAGAVTSGTLIGPGTGDNAASLLGLDARPGDAVVSIGTSGVVCARRDRPSCDPGGTIAGFASATGDFLPLVCTLNAARVLEAAADLLGLSLDRLSAAALSAAAGAGGMVFIPYLEGERTPNRPDASASVHGLRLGNCTPANLARAAVEGVLCGLADGLEALTADGLVTERVLLIGGGSRAPAVRRVAPTVLGRPVAVPAPAEYTALGAARQAAWVLTGGPAPPEWPAAAEEIFDGGAVPSVRERYAIFRDSLG